MTLSSIKADLLERVADAIRTSEWQVLFENADHPCRMVAFRGAERKPLLVYIWRVTPGGGGVGVRPAGEIRIQLTGVPPPFQRSTDFQTLLLGYLEAEDVFVGYDVSRRPQMWGSSPSVQLRMSAVTEAKERGFGFYRRHTKTQAELAIAFRPDAFMDYVERQSELHLFADDKEATATLENAATEAASGSEGEIDLDVISGEGRRAAVRTVIERVGQQNFRARVLSVYTNQCALCSIQLNLLDAAHIVPLPGGGTNETRNGLALCKIHHSAYDRGLIGIFPDYSVLVNESEVMRLQKSKRHGGLPSFRSGLLPTLRQPQRPQDRPFPEYLAYGLAVRGWQGIVASRS